MAAGAVQAESRREEPHRVHELICGNALQDLDILENIFGHLRSLISRLS
jgi:transcriptional antiterminator